MVIRRVVGKEYVLIYNQSENLVEKGLAAARYFARYDSNLICPVAARPFLYCACAVKIHEQREWTTIGGAGNPAPAICHDLVERTLMGYKRWVAIRSTNLLLVKCYNDTAHAENRTSVRHSFWSEKKGHRLHPKDVRDQCWLVISGISMKS